MSRDDTSCKCQKGHKLSIITRFMFGWVVERFAQLSPSKFANSEAKHGRQKSFGPFMASDVDYPTIIGGKTCYTCASILKMVFCLNISTKCTSVSESGSPVNGSSPPAVIKCNICIPCNKWPPFLAA